MKVTFFTGAGISQSAGIPTFRDAGGLWHEFDPAVVCSLRGYQRNRPAVLAFHNEIRRIIDLASPTLAHKAIAAFERHAEVTVVTQNIDDLHERAGSTNVLKIHGDIHTARVKRYKDPTLPWTSDILPSSFPEGFPGSRGTMRHDVVFFGEQIKHRRKIQSAVSNCDYLVVCGTSLAVFPAAGFVLNARGPTKIYVDPNPPETVREAFFRVIEREANEGIVEAMALIATTERGKEQKR